MAKRKAVEEVTEDTPEETHVEREEARASRAMPALGRGWSERYVQPVKYSHSTFKDAMGRELIAFRFDLPPGQTKPDEDVIEIMRAHKFFKNGEPNGLAEDAREDAESFPTGLHYQDYGPRIGKAWVVQNDKMGRMVAESLNDKLSEIAKKKESDIEL